MKFILNLTILFCLFSCNTNQLLYPSSPENELYKVTILYPNGEGKTFDMNYYGSKHMPMVASFIGENLKFYEIDKGISGRTPNAAPPYLAVGYFFITNVEAYNKAIGANIAVITSDFKNYTNIQPIVQISEIKQVVTPK